MTITEGTVFLRTEEDLKELLNKYQCDSVDKLADILWFNYGITLIDDRREAEFSQVNAQHSPEFFSEETTQEEYEEYIERLKIYGTGESS